MNMLGHDDVSEHNKTIATAHGFEDVEEQVTVAGAGQKWVALITTES
jgi:hypothetical protein